MCIFSCVMILTKVGERGRGAKYLGPGLVIGARNMVKHLVIGATVKRVGGP